MSKRKLYNLNNELISIEVIRFFKNNDVKYLIYTLIENDSTSDDTGYSKLYVTKNIDNYLTTISDENEWTLVKDIIKNVIKSNRDGIEINILDQDEDDLDNYVIKDNRVFKLQGNLVNLLQENKKIEAEIEVQEITDMIEEIEEQTEIDYRKLYELEKEKNEKLIENMNLLKEKIADINEILIEI